MACRKRAASRVAERRWWATIRRQALRGASQVRCPIGCQVALARRLPTNLMPFQKLCNPYQQASRLLWLLKARLVTWLAFPRAERRNLAKSSAPAVLSPQQHSSTNIQRYQLHMLHSALQKRATISHRLSYQPQKDRCCSQGLVCIHLKQAIP